MNKEMPRSVPFDDSLKERLANPEFAWVYVTELRKELAEAERRDKEAFEGYLKFHRLFHYAQKICSEQAEKLAKAKETLEAVRVNGVCAGELKNMVNETLALLSTEVADTQHSPENRGSEGEKSPLCNIGEGEK